MARRDSPRTTLEQVRIIRRGLEAIIEYAITRRWRIDLGMGPELSQLTDREILERWNDYVGSIELGSAQAQSIGGLSES